MLPLNVNKGLQKEAIPSCNRKWIMRPGLGRERDSGEEEHRDWQGHDTLPISEPPWSKALMVGDPVGAFCCEK